MTRCYKCLEIIEANASVKHGLHETCFREWFLLDNIEDFAEVIVRSAGSAEPPDSKDEFSRINESFFHGAYKKYSAILGGRAYILKVKDPRFPELPGTEYLCNQIAKHLKIVIPKFYYIKYEGSTDTFVTQNFIHDIPASNLVHVYHFLDEVGGVREGEGFNCENIIKIIGIKTGRLPDIERFIELCLFDALIGNHDRHGRNIAFIQTKKGFELAPFYDNPTYIGIEEVMLGAQLEPRGKIWTSNSKEPSMKDYVYEFIRLGYKPPVEKFHKKVVLEEIISIIDKSFISEKRKNSFKLLIQRRFKELIDGISN